MLAQEFLSLKQKTETVTKIIRMFHKRALFFHEHVSSEKAHVSQYLSILRRDIRKFVLKTSYWKLDDLQTNVGRREIELETQA